MLAAWTDFTLDQPKIVKKLASLGVDWRVNEEFETFGDSKVHFACTYTGERKVSLAFDSFIFVGARLPNNSLATELKAHMLEDKFTVIGDALVPGLIQAAVYSGHRMALVMNGEDLSQAEFRRDKIEVL